MQPQAFSNGAHLAKEQCQRTSTGSRSTCYFRECALGVAVTNHTSWLARSPCQSAPNPRLIDSQDSPSGPIVGSSATRTPLSNSGLHFSLIFVRSGTILG